MSKKAPNETTESQTTLKQETKKTTKTAPKSGKENDSKAANKADTVVKARILSEIAQTTETKAATNEKEPNKRYAASESELKIDMEDQNDEPLRAPQVPFYMKQTMSNDEDVEAFQRKLDTLIVNFRSETMSEFIKTKKHVIQDQAQTIDAERRRCNTLLGVKHNEIEQLKESLGLKTKLAEDLNTRCEGMAFWAGKSKMLLRIKLLQFKAFDSLRKYRDFQKHSKKVLEHRQRQYLENQKRRVFLAWEKHYKQWKIVKNREDFEKAVKLELQHICAQYNKEIESLRDKLSEAQAIVDSEHRTKAMMQEQLKKAFMRGVCALNFEAMNILNPSDQQQQIEREMERQVVNAMNSVELQSPFANPTTNPVIYRSISETLTPQSQSSLDLENAYHEGKMTQVDGPQPNPFQQNIVEQTELPYHLKVESKDTLWRPAPVMGREMSQVVPSFNYQQPSITSQLKGNTQSSVVLSSHFTKLETVSKAEPVPLNEDTSSRVLPGNHAVISSLPDFVSSGAQAQGGEGKTIVGKVVAAAKPTSTTSKKPITSSATSRKNK